MDQNDSIHTDMEKIDQFIQEAMEGNRSAGLTTLTNTAAGLMHSQAKKVATTLVGYKELMMMYTCAMKAIRMKFEILNTEFNVRYQRNPISSISTRLKRTSSIVEKLGRRALPFTLENIEGNIHDVAGIRVVCYYVDDIYQIADALLRQDDIELLERKDYIATPKPNGYRSLHLIVKVPVFFADQKRELKVEVQIRTIAMDFWASLEHQLKYKQDIPNQQNIIAQLKACADVITETDKKMLDIRCQIESMADAPTEEDILFEKLTRLDISLN